MTLKSFQILILKPSVSSAIIEPWSEWFRRRLRSYFYWSAAWLSLSSILMSGVSATILPTCWCASLQAPGNMQKLERQPCALISICILIWRGGALQAMLNKNIKIILKTWWKTFAAFSSDGRRVLNMGISGQQHRCHKLKIENLINA